ACREAGMSISMMRFVELAGGVAVEDKYGLLVKSVGIIVAGIWVPSESEKPCEGKDAGTRLLGAEILGKHLDHPFTKFLSSRTSSGHSTQLCLQHTIMSHPFTSC